LLIWLIFPVTSAEFPLNVKNEIQGLLPNYVWKYSLTISDVRTMFNDNSWSAHSTATNSFLSAF